MRPNYKDIIDEAGPPEWYDEYGVPRYCEFHPAECGVYISAATYIVIQCQSCQSKFRVATVWDSRHTFTEQLSLAMAEGKSTWGIHMANQPAETFAPPYGDPPRHGCSEGGETMSSNTVQVLEYWRQDDWTWTRHPEIEKNMNANLQT